LYVQPSQKFVKIALQAHWLHKIFLFSLNIHHIENIQIKPTDLHEILYCMSCTKIMWSREPSVNIVTRLTGWTTGVRFPSKGRDLFLFVTASRLALGSTQPVIQWEYGALPQVVKRPG